MKNEIEMFAPELKTRIYESLDDNPFMENISQITILLKS